MFSVIVVIKLLGVMWYRFEFFLALGVDMNVDVCWVMRGKLSLLW